jgi:SAM-dependent methyltransferase
MYDFDWHKTHGDETSASAHVVVSLLKLILEVRSVLDVGCGDGRWLACFKSSGVPSIYGVDGEWTDQEHLLIDKAEFTVRDLSKSFDLGKRFDIAISLEVAEHVDAECSALFVENLTKHSDMVLFGAAIPFQGGFRHINERWQSSWAALFEAQGYQCFDPFRSQIWQRRDVSVWYRQNMLVYIKRERSDLISQVEKYLSAYHISEMPIDIVHPERYESIASYSQIAFKPLMRKLPAAFVGKFVSVLLGKN